MTAAKELGRKGLKALIGKEVVLKYPKYGHRRGFSRKEIITNVHKKGPQFHDSRLVEFEGKGLQWVWDDTDVSEVHPNRIQQLFQRITRK